MCGIAGTYGFGDRMTLGRMLAAIGHRGPDGTYLHVDGPARIGNVRLAIRDIAGGEQPMFSADGTVAVVYNGEIYNYDELRADLTARGYVLKTRCDTELLPHLYSEYGDDFAARLNGIFAIALWDQNRQRLVLVRDPLGVKPLVYSQAGGRFAFGSEAKAILASGLVAAEADPISLHLSMNMRYVPGERTMFRGIRRLPPGHLAVIDKGGMTSRSYVEIDWTPDETLSEQDWLEGIVAGLEAAVSRQLVADVPLGISLSGGIDSSLLVALVRRRQAGTIKTFTLGFNEPTDENEDARRVAEHFGTEHHDLVLEGPAIADLDRVIEFTEEPKVNCLQLFQLHDFLSKHVKVALSGLGGDELFGGYDIYRYLIATDKARSWLPAPLWGGMAAPVLRMAAHFGARLDRPRFDLTVRKCEFAAALHDGCGQYLQLRNCWDTNRELMDRIYEPDFAAAIAPRCRDFYEGYFEGHGYAQGAMRAEFATKMVNDLLLNEDTMSMASSVESRVPILDLEFVRFTARIPAALRFRYGMKGLLKRALAGILPDEVLYKKKWGFTVDPVEQFRRGMKPIAETVLLDPGFAGRGIFRASFIEKVLNERPSAGLRWHYFMLWQMVGYAFWSKRFAEGAK